MDQIVPLSNSPHQTMAVALTVDGKPLTLQLAIRFSEIQNYWVMRISDASGNVLVDSIPMVTGAYPAANLLAQHRYLGIGSTYIVNASGVASDYPDSTNLGSDFILVWGDTPAI